MAVLGELLFYERGGRRTLDDVLRHMGSDQMRQIVERLPSTAFTRSDEELAKEVADAARVSPLEVDFDAAVPRVSETSVEVSGFDYGFPRDGTMVPGLEATKTIPFKGDRDLWLLQPNPYDMNPPRGDVERAGVRIGITVPAAQGDQAVAYLDDTIGKIKVYLEHQRRQIEQFNSALEQRALPFIRDRRTRVGGASDLLKKLGG